MLSAPAKPVRATSLVIGFTRGWSNVAFRIGTARPARYSNDSPVPL
ncbi:MAG: hypothetical protein BWX70_02632 [Verrucomicrobia bacterium ADurb.Bin070]|nr:MAG: hypothetical protein BWX70_02632 [Verrucomicrobia bacterium ADurb.Bin070]